MNCPNCGAENQDGSKWCGSCGKELKRKKILLLISSIMLIIYGAMDVWSYLSRTLNLLTSGYVFNQPHALLFLIFTFIFLIGAITGFIAGVTSLISISKNKPASNILAIISFVCYIFSGIISMGVMFGIIPIWVTFTSLFFIMLLPVCIFLLLYFIGVKRYNW